MNSFLCFKDLHSWWCHLPFIWQVSSNLVFLFIKQGHWTKWFQSVHPIIGWKLRDEDFLTITSVFFVSWEKEDGVYSLHLHPSSFICQSGSSEPNRSHHENSMQSSCFRDLVKKKKCNQRIEGAKVCDELIWRWIKSRNHHHAGMRAEVWWGV